MSTYNKLLHSYHQEFEDKGLYPESIKLFLFELCNEKDINLYTELDNEADKDIEEKFHSGIKRLLNNEPLNYVLGYSYFFGYKMIVNKDVLIPRYETEELVGLILSKYDEYFKGKKINLCDIGTGSGAIAIALKAEENNLNVYASDISSEAIEVAKANAKNNDVKVSFMVGDMLEPFKALDIKFDILVSNPPYIPSDEVMEKSVIDYEPHVALFGGSDGLKFYREIFEGAKDILNEHSLLFFEIGYDQKERLEALAHEYFKDAEVKTFKDINSKDRMLMIKR